MKSYDKLIFELSKKGRKAYSLPKVDVEEKDISNLIPEEYLSEEELKLPEVSELDVVRHYTNLSQLNYSIDTGFYPLGSCTMKYNPKINEEMAGMDSMTNLHPYQPEETVQGALELMYNLSDQLAEVSGMDKVTLQPAAGAQGELTGIMLIKAYHRAHNNTEKTKIIVPDSAHGTNPATAAMAGYDILKVASSEEGLVDMDSLKSLVDESVAGLMLTNPNTLGLFEKDMKEIAELIHDVGGLLYYDGANMNAIMGKVRPGDMGFDVMHFNLHKTFSTPHGGGGPGSGAVGVKEHLVKYLPVPVVEKQDDKFVLDYDRKDTIGKVKGFYGNYGVNLRAYTFILAHGGNGLKTVSETAVLNANYMMSKLKENYNLPIKTVCKHEFVLAGLKGDHLEVSTLDVAKRLMDYGYHPPTVYFPLIVKEALMIEPTETESKETLDNFIDAMNAIAKEANENPKLLKEAPCSAPVRRVDEVRAARNLVLKWN